MRFATVEIFKVLAAKLARLNFELATLGDPDDIPFDEPYVTSAVGTPIGEQGAQASEHGAGWYVYATLTDPLKPEPHQVWAEFLLQTTDGRNVVNAIFRLSLKRLNWSGLAAVSSLEMAQAEYFDARTDTRSFTEFVNKLVADANLLADRFATDLLDYKAR